MNNEIVKCYGLNKSYHDGNVSIDVLKNIDFTIYAGARIAIVGPSGSGKSTLLHLLGGLDKPTAGHVTVDGIDWLSLPERERCRLRNKQLGFVYQFHHLLPEFSALENIAMPLLIGNVPVAEAMDRAQQILAEVGLSERVHHKPAQLSGGERQRVAIGRALVHKPSCVFADEPTGNLDQTTAAKIFDLMMELNANSNTALLVVTHDRQLAARMDVVMILQEGRLTVL